METPPNLPRFGLPRRRALLFLVAILAFLAVCYVPVLADVRAAGDVLLYERYALGVLGTPMELPREYPPFAALVFVLPQLIAPGQYVLAFAVLAALTTWLIVVIADHLSGRGWWLMMFLTLGTGGTLFFRFDIYVVLLTALALLAAQKQRWNLAQLCLVLGFALKLYPLLLMPLVLVAEWRATRRLPFRSAFSGAALFAIVVGAMWLWAPAQTVAMLQYHQARPLEFESIGASIIWLLGPVEMRWSFGSINLLSPSATTVIYALAIANAAALVALYVAILRKGVSLAGSWALVLLVAVATSKVFSTQYLMWVLPFVVIAGGPQGVGLRAHRSLSQRWLWLLICTLTTLVYPVSFGLAEASLTAFMMPDWLMALVTLRNVFWLVACVLGVRYWIIGKTAETACEVLVGSSAAAHAPRTLA